MTQWAPPRSAYPGGYFGLCPACRREPEFIHIRKDHYGTCPEHKVYWWVGYNLLGTYWRAEDDDLVAVVGHADRDRLTREAQAKLEAYRQVEPFYPDDHLCSPTEVPQECEHWPGEHSNRYVVSWSSGNGWFRRTCAVCLSPMGKDSVVAFVTDPDGDRDELCDACVAAGPDAIREHCRQRAMGELEGAVERSAAYAAASRGEWVMPQPGVGEQLRRERDDELERDRRPARDA